MILRRILRALLPQSPDVPPPPPAPAVDEERIERTIQQSREIRQAEYDLLEDVKRINAKLRQERGPRHG